MREELEKQYGERKKFVGTFKRFGRKRDYNGNIVRTVLLVNVKDENDKIVADHLWFNYTKRFQKLGGLHQGDIIEFYARVKKYFKGYINRRDEFGYWERGYQYLDYKLSYPTKIRKIEE
jgi:hypothetical protein